MRINTKQNEGKTLNISFLRLSPVNSGTTFETPREGSGSELSTWKISQRGKLVKE